MELKFVIPKMEKTFGNLEFAGEDKVVQRRINGHLTVLLITKLIANTVFKLNCTHN